jgi:hypothetical protein
MRRAIKSRRVASSSTFKRRHSSDDIATFSYMQDFPCSLLFLTLARNIRAAMPNSPPVKPSIPNKRNPLGKLASLNPPYDTNASAIRNPGFTFPAPHFPDKSRGNFVNSLLYSPGSLGSSRFALRPCLLLLCTNILSETARSGPSTPT